MEIICMKCQSCFLEKITDLSSAGLAQSVIELYSSLYLIDLGTLKKKVLGTEWSPIKRMCFVKIKYINIYPAPWLVYHGWFKLVFESLGVSPDSARKHIFRDILTLSTLGKIFSRQHFEIFFLIFPGKQDLTFMQIVSWGDTLHEMSNPVYWEK